MSKKTLFAVALIVTGMALSAHASAEPYLGASIGKSKWNLDCTGATYCKKSATSYQITSGYNFNPVWAMEGSFFSLGEISANNATIAGVFKSSGVDLTAVAKTPAKKGFIGLAKMGLAYVKGEAFGTAGNLSGSSAKYSVQPVLGFGVIYQVNDAVDLRAEYTYRKTKVADIEDTTANVSTFTIGAQSSF
jgi:opacity protein-like surface antigen